MFQENPALYRRQQTSMLEGCVARAAVIRCEDAGKADPDCAKLIESHGEPEALAGDAFKAGWRTSASDEARVAYCPFHSRQRGLRLP
jgi:hypothetical protein